MTSHDDLTACLEEWSREGSTALEDVIVLVYTDLRRLARSLFKGERSALTLEPTEVVHELYKRLYRLESTTWKTRAQFFAFARIVMRRVLVDWARHKKAVRHGGDLVKVPLDFATSFSGELNVQPDTLLALDQAMKCLGSREQQVVELLYFLGLTINETAEALALSRSTVKRSWKEARASLACKLAPSAP